MNPTFLQVSFTRKNSECPINKIVDNFLITNPNGPNQNFVDTQKYNLWKNKTKRNPPISIIFFLLPHFPNFERTWIELLFPSVY